MKKTYCDRCGTVITVKKYSFRELDPGTHMEFEDFDICNDCGERIINMICGDKND